MAKLLICFILFSKLLSSQIEVNGKIITPDKLDFSLCKFGILNSSQMIKIDSLGNFNFSWPNENSLQIKCDCEGFESKTVSIYPKRNQKNEITIFLTKKLHELEEVLILGTMKEVNRLDNPIITDVYDKKFFAKNPSPNLLDMMDRMNGVRSQVNCNVCGTGDIHLNGLEGSYTLIILDGVPIVGGLSSVYGLSGIPSFLLDRIEITKGPASSVYGSEAVAGVIHAFTKKPTENPEIQLQNFTTSHLESNTDLGINFKLGKKINAFTTVNHFYNNLKLDHNKDNFTDIPLQNRFSFFQKITFERKDKKLFTLNGRYLQESRWGGELNWDRKLLGGDSIYGEAIKIKRGEVNLMYQLPIKEKILFVSHLNIHQQRSFYGNTQFDADQQLAFFQLTWDKKYNNHQFFSGITYRETHYDDNTVLTQTTDSIAKNRPLITQIPSIFWQHDIKIKSKTTFLYSFRLDYQQEHKIIFTPRLAILHKLNDNMQFRLHAGTGFRIVNLFSEDHASLTGSRQIVIAENLEPEKSKSINSAFSYTKKIYQNLNLEIDIQTFYTYFSNRIIPDYLTNSNQIIYSNSLGYGQSLGSSLDIKLTKSNHFSLQAGITFMEINSVENGIKKQQLLTEKVSGNFTFSYYFKKIPLSIDYTVNFVGPMRLPILSELDPRPEYSKTYSIQNIQLSYKLKENILFFGGVKNLLNWTPAKGIPFLIARANDPFDKQVSFDEQGNILASNSNPYALSFDPAYVYAPNQGIRFFLGIRMTFKQKNIYK
jgi:outer membrane receptor for ferrienterochelin and colicins